MRLDDFNTFYLGKRYAENIPADQQEYVLYPSKQLTTHGFCVGMTGSGKTGLCIGLLEEAALDGIPALILDVKGDITNLLLQFPNLAPGDFAPWVNVGGDEASRDQKAAETAKNWREGLASWGIDGERIAALRQRVDFALYSPGSTAARPLSIAQLFTHPGQEVLADTEVLAATISASVTAFLGLLQIDADPLQSREFILLSNLVGQAWMSGKSLDLPALIEGVRQPSFDRLGVMPLESFYPAKDRFAFALQINALLANPTWSAWLTGEAPDIERLLQSPSGKPQISILYLAHLSDAERMFFVTWILNRTLAWMRRQTGTSSLRALLYMDEIFGYFPPSANPPSKKPLLTLLKQARAFGLGLLLATQNPVDLDYKALSNCGTWWIGRLQTERDRARLLDGLSSASETAFPRAQWEQLLAGLPKRVFVQHTTAQSEPILLQTRWCMSYLAGPLDREQVRKLHEREEALRAGQLQAAPLAGTAAEAQSNAGSPDFASLAQAYLFQAPGAKPVATPAPTHAPSPAPSPAPAAKAEDTALDTPNTEAPLQVAPQLPPEIKVVYSPRLTTPEDGKYEPYLYGCYTVYFQDTKADLTLQRIEARMVPLGDGVLAADWDNVRTTDLTTEDLLRRAPHPMGYASLPQVAQKASQYKTWEKQLTNQVYRSSTIELYYCAPGKLYSKPDEDQAAFTARVRMAAQEELDAQMDKLKQKYEKRLNSLQEKLRRAEQSLEREEAQAKQSSLNTAISFGASLLSGFLGGRRSAAGRLATTARSMNRSRSQKGDVDRSRETVEHYQQQLQELEDQLTTEAGELRRKIESEWGHLEVREFRPLKKDVQPIWVSLLWEA